MTYLQFIDYGDKSSTLKVISLHGFPSVRSKQNREIAQGIADELQCRVRVVLYPGLSCSGLFSFKKTIEAMVTQFPELTADEGKVSQKIDLLGHSFGGFAALLLAAEYPQLVRRMVLLSPLLKFSPSASDVSAFFRNILSTNSNASLNTLTPDELGQEFHDLSKIYQTEKSIERLDPKLKVKLMQARGDTVTPTAIAEEFRRHFKCDLNFELVEQDHSFLVDRLALSKQIAQFFK